MTYEDKIMEEFNELFSSGLYSDNDNLADNQSYYVEKFIKEALTKQREEIIKELLEKIEDSDLITHYISNGLIRTNSRIVKLDEVKEIIKNL